MTLLNTARVRRIAVTAAAVGALSVVAPATASADIIDDALNAIPSGQISCSQAEGVWNGEADYNNKVAQANALAIFDSRGPQIRAALARVDEAANRCGLKGGGNAGNNAGNNNAPVSNNGGGNTNTPAPGNNGGNNQAPAPAEAAPAISLAAPGAPSFSIQVPGIGGVQLPDLNQIVREFLAQFGIKI